MVLRRLQLIEAMNFCERRGFTYRVTWNPVDQYVFEVPYVEWQQKLDKHLLEWEKAE